MGGLASPRKNFRYLMEFDGADAFLIQEIDAPEVELPEIEHAAPGNIPNAKTPDKMKVSQLVVKKLKPANRADTWAWDMMADAAAGLTPDFVKIGFLHELGPNMVNNAQSFFIGNAWVSKIVNPSYKGEGGENLIEEVTFSVQYYYPTDSANFVALFNGTAAVAAGRAFTSGNA